MFRLLRFITTLMLALSLSGLSPIAGELAERAAEETTADANCGPRQRGEHDDCDDDCDDGCDDDGCCVGFVHSCGCCAAALPPDASRLPVRTARRVQHRLADDDDAHEGIRARIDRPPRA
ncbi:MAG: hypothetical protein H6713_34065 [Myxococcales bacterium]|nr:hypothetical protein [Myxococcales bacterium]MCB9754991.1 hypothetical protein [Myxococcales bacterium]